MKSLKIFFIILNIFICNSIYSQDYLELLEVKNEKLTTIIDSIINHEMTCDYYNSDLLFAIHSQFINDTIILLIGSIGIETTRLGNELGCFEHKGHLFIVYGQQLDNTLFATTGKKRSFTYYLPYNYEESNKLNMDIIEDDSFSFWIYRYLNGEFIFEGKSSYCN